MAHPGRVVAALMAASNGRSSFSLHLSVLLFMWLIPVAIASASVVLVEQGAPRYPWSR